VLPGRRKICGDAPAQLGELTVRRYVYALDLVETPSKIADYEAWHRADRIWPAIVASLKSSGLANAELLRTGNRLVLIIDAPDDFSPDSKAASDARNPDVQAWETLMWSYQRALPWAKPGEKWVLMESIFSLAKFGGNGQ
jgi:L-rhamnose mutarotase